MKTRHAIPALVLAVLALCYAGPLPAQVSLRPPPDTTTHPLSPDARAFALAKPRHGHPWLGAAIGAVAGGVIGYAAWRPSSCEGWFCFGGPSQGEAAAIGAAAGALLGWAIGAALAP